MKVTQLSLLILVMLLFALLVLPTEAKFRRLQQQAPKVSNITLPSTCFNFTTGYLFCYNFNNDSDNTVDFYVSYTTQNWFGFGFGSSMMNADVIIIEIINNAISITDGFSQDEVQPPSDVSLGGKNDLTLLEYVLEPNKVVVHMRRKQNTGDSNDFVLNGPGKYSMIYAFSKSKTIAMHSREGSIKVTLLPTPNPSTTNTTSSTTNTTQPSNSSTTNSTAATTTRNTTNSTTTKNTTNSTTTKNTTNSTTTTKNTTNATTNAANTTTSNTTNSSKTNTTISPTPNTTKINTTTVDSPTTNQSNESQVSSPITTPNSNSMGMDMNGMLMPGNTTSSSTDNSSNSDADNNSTINTTTTGNQPTSDPTDTEETGELETEETEETNSSTINNTLPTEPQKPIDLQQPTDQNTSSTPTINQMGNMNSNLSQPMTTNDSEESNGSNSNSGTNTSIPVMNTTTNPIPTMDNTTSQSAMPSVISANSTNQTSLLPSNSSEPSPTTTGDTEESGESEELPDSEESGESEEETTSNTNDNEYLLGMLRGKATGPEVTTMQLPSTYVNIIDGITLYYQFNHDQSIDLWAVYHTQNWLGLGLGESMMNVDMIIIEIINNTVVVSDAYSKSHSTPELDINLGGTSDIQLVEYLLNSTTTIAHIRRKEVTGDSNDFMFTGPGSYSLIYATTNSPTMETHEDGENTSIAGVMRADFTGLPGGDANYGDLSHIVSVISVIISAFFVGLF